MPSIFTRNRRSSEIVSPESTSDDSPIRNKRASMDISHKEVRNRPSPSASAKLKAMLGSKGADGDETKMESMRKRLSSPSTFFQKNQVEDPHSAPMASDNHVEGTSVPPTNTSGSPIPPSTMFPGGFSLASSTSPETAGSRQSWQPSYPLAVDEGYADVPPDGRSNGHANGNPSPKIPVQSSENSQRRSDEFLLTPSPDDMSAWPAMKPAAKVHSAQTALPTPPPTAAPTPTGTSQPAEQPVVAKSPVPTINGSTAASQPPRPRPDMPLRRSTLIQSPPMPQPIRHLPTLGGWQSSNLNRESGSETPRGFMMNGGPKTPGWGALAREGGPKTPGWGGLLPGGPRTPSAGGFPFMSPSITPNVGKEKSRMSEDELRRARRAMPVMLREPSFQPVHHDDGGEAGDDDDESDESGTEVEGQADGDSDEETETERAAAASKARRSINPMKNTSKGKAKTTAHGSSRLAMSSVREEDAPPTANRQNSGASRPSGLKFDTKPNLKSAWALPTPTQKPSHAAGHGSWMAFGAGSPAGTPVGSRPPGASTTSGPSTGSISRTQSSTGSAQSSTGTSEGYFDSQPSSSQASLGTPRQGEPVLLSSTSATRAPGPSASLGLGAVIPESANEEASHDNGEGDGDDESDDGSGSEGTEASSHDHASASPTTIPTPPPTATRPGVSNRPSLYSRPSQSMVNLSTSSTQPIQNHSDITRRDDKASIGPRLATIRSREAVPNRIELPPTSTSLASGMLSPTSEWAKPPPTPAAGFKGFSWGKNKDAETKGTMKRRRSADDISAPPPDYEPPFPGTFIPRPRDEEGKEKLPGYWCAVHIEGNLSRKMEFSSPGVQSRDRSWKKLYFILNGTSLHVYKFDPHRFPLKFDAAIPTVSEAESEEHLHVHVPGEKRVDVNPAVGARRGSVAEGPGASPTSRAARGTSVTGSPTTAGSSGSSDGRRGSVTSTSPSTISSASEKDATLFPSLGVSRGPVSTAASSSSGGTSIASHFQANATVKTYTLQNAESGLAADYIKRSNVVRVRCEGEQFLLQTDNAREVVDWIEAFQAATNVALDLDDRPMPKIITLPRRRRRRPVGAAAILAASAAAGGGTTTSATAASNAAADAADRDRERMLAEDQART